MNSESKFPPFGSPDWHTQRAEVMAQIGRAQRASRLRAKEPPPTQAQIDASERALNQATYGDVPQGDY